MKSGMTAQTFLMTIPGLAGLTSKSDMKSPPSEQESRVILSLILGDEQKSLNGLLDRDLNPSEAQKLQSISELGARVFLDGPNPMY